MKSFSLFLCLFIITYLALALSHSKTAEVKDLSTPKDRSVILDLKTQSIRVEDNFPDSSIRLLRRGLNLSRKVHYVYGEALMMARFSEINQKYGNFAMALKYQQEALVIFNRYGQWADIAAANLALGNIYGSMHKLAAGQQFLDNALKIYEQKNNLSGKCEALIRMGRINELNRRYSAAFKYDLQALHLMQSGPLNASYFSLLIHIAGLQEKLGHYQNAIACYETGISQSNFPQFGIWHITLLREAGALWDRLGKSARAGSFYQRSIAKAREFLLPAEEAKSHVSFAMSVSKIDLIKSISHLKNALSLSKMIGNQRLTAEIFHSLSGLYQQQLNYKEALTSLQEHHRLVDSLKGINIGHKLALLQGSYEIAENKILIQNLELINKKGDYQRTVQLLLLAATSLIIVVIVFYFYRTRMLNKQLKEANLTKDKLFSIIGHDLRNPIGGITQLLGIMEETALSGDEYHDMIGRIKKQGEVTLEILNALLSWGETQLKGVTVKRTKFSPEISIARNIEALETQRTDKQLDLVNKVSPQLLLDGDNDHFDFIIRNLLSNAIKFSERSGVIEINAEDHEDMIVFSVQDNGKGISEQQQKQFQQANMDVSFGTNGEKGTGIGLLLTKEFVKANRGSIWIKSSLGKGTIFYFSFPRFRKH